MSGLILAGLGRGISDAATTFGTSMMRQNEEAARAAREEARDARKLEAAETKEEQRKQQVIAEIAAAREGGAQLGRERIAGQVLAQGGANIAGDSPVMEQAELAQLIQDNPQFEQTYRQAGLIQDGMDPRLQRATDQYDAALGAGASSTTLEGLEKTKQAALTAIRDENKQKADDRRLDLQMARMDQQDRQFMAGLGVRQQQADTTAARATGEYDSNRPATTADMQRQVNASENLLAKELGVPKANINGQLNALRRRAETGSQESQATLDRIAPLLKEFEEANRRMLNFRRTDEPFSSDNTRTQSGPGTLPEPKSRADLEGLAPGTRYKAPDGTIRTKS